MENTLLPDISQFKGLTDEEIRLVLILSIIKMYGELKHGGLLYSNEAHYLFMYIKTGDQSFINSIKFIETVKNHNSTEK